MRPNLKTWSLVQSWKFMRNCLQFIFKNKSLMIIPFFGLVSVTVVGGLISFALFEISVQELSGGELSSSPLVYVAAQFVMMYFLLNFIALFFNSALLICVISRLKQEPCSIIKGLGIASTKIMRIFGWSLLTGSVGLLLNLAERSNGLFRNLVVGLINCSWSVVSYFVLPLIIIDDLSPLAALKKSYQSFKGNWRKMFSVFGFLFLALFPLMMVASFMFAFVPSTPFLVMISVCCLAVLFFPLIFLFSVLNVVVKASLYLETLKNSHPNGIDKELLSQILVRM